MKFNKPLIITAGIAIGISVMMSVNAFTIQSNVLNAVATFQQFFVTSDGNAPSGSNQIVSFNQGLNNKVVFAPNSVVLSGIIASGANQALGTDSQGNIISKTIAGGGNSQWTGNINITTTNTGNVGIGINNPTAKLHVVGNSVFSGNTTIGNATTLIATGGNVGIGITNPTAKLHIVGNTILSGNTTIGNATTLMAIGGNVGIGTASPNSKLHVVGDSTFSGNLLLTLNNSSVGNSDLNDISFRGYSEAGIFINKLPGFNSGANLTIKSSPAISENQFGGDINILVPFAGIKGGDINITAGDALDIPGSVTIQGGSLESNFDTTRVFLNPGGGRVGIGTYSPTQRLHVVGNLRVQGSTDCLLGTTAGSVSCTSDQRLKKDIVPIRESLDKILSLTGVYYNWKDIARGTNRHIGFLAQNVEKVFPELVIQGDNGYKMLSMEGLIAPLVNAIKEQQVQINELKKELQLLKK